MTDSCSGVGRRELEADSGISRTDDSLRNDESSEHEMIDTDSAASPSSGSAKYDSLWPSFGEILQGGHPSPRRVPGFYIGGTEAARVLFFLKKN